MFNNTPNGYVCPICPAVQGKEGDETLIVQSDIVYRDNDVTGLINSFFIGNNPGHIIVVPNQHVEHLYDLPTELGGKIMVVAQKLAIAMRQVYGCEGVTVQQNNEPAGGQHAFHYHMHLFPRYTDDNIYQYMGSKRLASPEERAQYSEKIRVILKEAL